MIRVDNIVDGQLLVPPSYFGHNYWRISQSDRYMWDDRVSPKKWNYWSASVLPSLFLGDRDVSNVHVGFINTSPSNTEKGRHFQDCEHFQLTGSLRNMHLDRLCNLQRRHDKNFFSDDVYAHIEIDPGNIDKEAVVGYNKQKPVWCAYSAAFLRWDRDYPGFLVAQNGDSALWYDSDNGKYTPDKPMSATWNNLIVWYVRCIDLEKNLWAASYIDYPSTKLYYWSKETKFTEQRHLRDRILAFAREHARELEARTTYSNVRGMFSGHFHGSKFIPTHVNVDAPSFFFPEEERNPNWNDLARDAYQDLGFFQGNGIALFNDIAHLRSSVSSTLTTIKSLGKGKLKAVAQLFLTFHFGWKLLALDVRDLRKTLERDISHQRRCQSSVQWESYSDSPVRYEARYQVFYDPLAQLDSLLEEFNMLMDLNLRLGSSWDFIPYSFVVDWFIQIGDVLTAIDNYYNLCQRHHVIAAGRSIKCERSVTPEDIGLDSSNQADLVMTYYHRKYQDKPIIPSILPATHQPISLQHFVEGTALVVSRK